jgi:hypothetical protein
MYGTFRGNVIRLDKTQTDSMMSRVTWSVCKQFWSALRLKSMFVECEARQRCCGLVVVVFDGENRAIRTAAEE